MLSVRRIPLSTILPAVLLGFFWAGLSVQAFGHETRRVGPYKIVLGFRNEPSFVDEPNAVDIFVSRASDDRPINRGAGDTVQLGVEVQLRDREAFDSRILRFAELNDPLTQAFQTPNRYNSWFKPTVDGTYAFHITGVVSDDTDPIAGRMTINETFVCGRGTLDPNGHGFHCVEVPQAFPRQGHEHEGDHENAGERQ